jgi:hypothetical protein
MATKEITITKFQVIEALHLKRGIITNVASHLRTTFDNIYKWIDNDSDIAEAFKEARIASNRINDDMKEQCIIEMWESLNYKLRAKDGPCTMFALKALGNIVEQQADNSIVVKQIERPYRASENEEIEIRPIE